LKRNYKLTLLLGLLVIVTATPGCGVINRLRAKDAVNDGVREFNKGKFDLAQEKFSRALELSPDLTNAQLFYARALNSQFDQNLTEDLGKKTVLAYDDIIARNQNNPEAVDQSLAFKANVYEKMASINPDKSEEYKQLQRDTLIKRAELPSATTRAKADVYYTLGVGYWKESYDMNAGYLMKKQPIAPEVLAKMKPIISKAHEMLEKAISIDPNYANAWFYEKLVYLEELKVDPSRQKELVAKVNDMQEKYNQIQKEQKDQGGEAASGQ
jgi:tetratricopeptide (TPR) repeat protein